MYNIHTKNISNGGKGYILWEGNVVGLYLIPFIISMSQMDRQR